LKKKKTPFLYHRLQYFCWTSTSIDNGDGGFQCIFALQALEAKLGKICFPKWQKKTFAASSFFELL